MDEELQPLGPEEAPENHSADELDEILIFGNLATRRHFLKQVAGTSAAITLGPTFLAQVQRQQLLRFI